MRLTQILLLGRYINPVNGRPVNVRKGQRVSGIGDIYFYLFRQKRVIIPESDFYQTWRKENL